MANEISSMIRTQAPPAPAMESGPFVKSEAVKFPDMATQTLPGEGKALPLQKVDLTELQEAVTQINDYVQTIQRDLSFSMDDKSGRTVISVIDSGSGELIRQIPSEEVLALATILKDVSAESAVSQEAPAGILFSEST